MIALIDKDISTLEYMLIIFCFLPLYTVALSVTASERVLTLFENILIKNRTEALTTKHRFCKVGKVLKKFCDRCNKLPLFSRVPFFFIK